MVDQGEPKRNGRPPHEPTVESRAQVKALAQYGATRDVIAHSLGIHPDTLRKHYEEELTQGDALGNLNIKRTLYQLATQQFDRGALIHLDKTRCGAVETSRHELTGADGGAIQHDTQDYDFTRLDTDEVLLLQDLLGKARVTDGSDR